MEENHFARKGEYDVDAKREFIVTEVVEWICMQPNSRAKWHHFAAKISSILNTLMDEVEYILCAKNGLRSGDRRRTI